MNTVVRPYSPADLAALTHVASAVAATDVPYPPPEAGHAPSDLARWLDTGTPLVRWVAEDAGRVVGHVQLSHPYPYLRRHLRAHHPPLRVDVELGRLFTHPDVAGTGIGRALLETALQHARARGHRTGLAVIDGSVRAERLYRAAGMSPAGSFTGIHGLNRVYVDNGSSAFTER